MSTEATSQRPYLLRAMHEWMTDNRQTPHVIVDVSVEGVEVPVKYVRDGKIVLNVSYAAAHNLDLGNDFIAFEARFSGVGHRVSIPLQAVLGIYARETGQGMVFSEAVSQLASKPASEEESMEKASAPDRSHLRVIK